MITSEIYSVESKDTVYFSQESFTKKQITTSNFGAQKSKWWLPVWDLWKCYTATTGSCKVESNKLGKTELAPALSKEVMYSSA